MVPLQREDQKDQHWERNRQSEGCRVSGMLCSCRVRTILFGGRGGGTAPLDQGALPGCQRVPITQAHQAAALLCTGLETALPRLQGRPGASLAMQHDH